MVSLISRKKSQEFSPLGPTKSRLAHSTGLTQQGYLFWRLCPHVRPQFGSKLGWIDLLQSIDEKKANAHLGRSFSDVFRWHKGHSKISLTRVFQKEKNIFLILKMGQDLTLIRPVQGAIIWLVLFYRFLHLDLLIGKWQVFKAKSF